jgi:hypothetical protein
MKMKIELEDRLLPVVLIATGAIEVELARRSIKEAIDSLRSHDEHNKASDLYEAIAPFVGYV